MSLKLPVM